MRKVISALAVLAALVCAPVALAASSPTVSASPVTSIGQTAATLHGSVNPNGLATTYQFHYGPTTALGSIAPAVAPSAGAGGTAASKSTKISGLVPDTTYYYELVASNSAGTSTTPIESFKTTGNPAPVTTTSPAVGVGRYMATLVGIINPDNEATTYHFQYGLTSSYGFQSSNKTVSPGDSPVAVSVVLPGLAPGTVYHYRLVASHGTKVTTYGQDQTFQTPPWPRPRTRLYLRARPRVARHAPYLYTLRGRIARSPKVPAAYGCHGTVTVRLYAGRRPVATRRVPLGLLTCSYRSQIRIGRRATGSTKRLIVRARYSGDTWEAPASASATLRAG